MMWSIQEFMINFEVFGNVVKYSLKCLMHSIKPKPNTRNTLVKIYAKYDLISKLNQGCIFHGFKLTNY